MNRFRKCLVLLVLFVAGGVPGTIARGQGGRNDPATEAAYQRAIQLEQQGRYDEAEKAYQAVFAAQVQRYGKKARNTLQTAFMLANVASEKGDYDTAWNRFSALREVQIEAFGRDSADVARTILYLAGILVAKDQLEEAEPLLVEAVRTYEKAHGPRHADLLTPLSSLALVEAKLGRLDEADRLMTRAFSLTDLLTNEKTRIFELMQLFNSWDVINQRCGRYAEAESAALAKIDLMAKAPQLRTSLPNAFVDLAGLYWRMGLIDKASAALNRSTELATQYNVSTPLYLKLLAFNWGRLFRSVHNYAEAEKMLVIARDLSIQMSGEDHPDTCIALGYLAQVYVDMQRYAEAEVLARKSLAGMLRRYPAEHFEVTIARGVLGDILFSQGKIAEAREQYERALIAGRRKLPPASPIIIDLLNWLQRIAAREGRWDDALALTDEARRGTRRHIREVLPELTPAEQLQFLFQQDAMGLIVALSLSVARSSEPQMRAKGAEWLMNAKSVGLQALAERTLQNRAAGDPRGAEIVRELQNVRRQLIRLRGKAAEADKVPEQLAAEIRQLVDRESQLAAEFARLAGLPQRADPYIELAELRAKLPAGARFVELSYTKIFAPDGSGPDIPPPHYVAWIVPPTGAGDVQLVDLGETDVIDAAVQGVRTALEHAPEKLQQGSRADAERILREPLAKLAQLVLHPLLPHLGPADRIELSPDASLWLVPWAALLLPDGRYAVEQYDIRYQTSGRELVAPLEAPPVGPPTVFADPNFDLSPAEAAAAAKSVLRGAQRRSGVAPTARPARAGIHVGRLPGTAREAAAIAPSLEQYAYGKPQMYLDRWALEGVFKSVQRPRVLVASTHGFFFEDQTVNEATAAEAGRSGGAATPLARDGRPMENPLARCGLLLAGCNQPPANPQQDDGILTGLEIVGTDLRGTELVVLSACQTGLGEANRGEGVAGLRQAFQLAGAQAVAATLWSIADEETAALMGEFFTGLAAGKGKSEALRAAQLKMIEVQRAQDKSTHPYFWAPFTLTGI